MPNYSLVVELFLGSSLITFDGTVVEAFGTRATSVGRVHLLALDHIEVGETRKDAFLQLHTIWRTSPVVIMFPKEQRSGAEEFASAVHRAQR